MRSPFVKTVALALALLPVALTTYASWPKECQGTLKPLPPPSSFSLPLELGVGAAFGRDTPAPATAALRLNPTVAFGGGVYDAILPLVADYRNPDFDALAGIGAAVKLWHADLPEAPIAGLKLGAEGLAGTRGSRVFAARITGDLGGLLLLSLRAARDFHHHETRVEVLLGTDLTWLFQGKAKDFTSLPAQRADHPVIEPKNFYDFLGTVTHRDMLAALHARPDNVVTLRTLLIKARSSGDPPGDLETLYQILPTSVVSQIPSSQDSLGEAGKLATFSHFDIPESPSPTAEVAGVLLGWCTALIEIK